MKFDTKLTLKTEITSDKITLLFERDGAIRALFYREISVIEGDLLESIAEVEEFLTENASVKVFEISEVKCAFEVSLKMAIIKEAEKELLTKGKSDLKTIISTSFFDRKTVKLATIEAYLLLLKDEVYNSYASSREAMRKLEGLKKDILNPKI